MIKILGYFKMLWYRRGGEISYGSRRSNKWGRKRFEIEYYKNEEGVLERGKL